MAGMRMPPMEAESATAVPETPAKIMEAMMFARPMPPRMWPMSLSQKMTICVVMPPEFMRLPARTKPGIQSMVKESRPAKKRAVMVLSGMPAATK